MEWRSSINQTRIFRVKKRSDSPNNLRFKYREKLFDKKPYEKKKKVKRKSVEDNPFKMFAKSKFNTLSQSTLLKIVVFLRLK